MGMSWEQWVEDFAAEEIEWATRSLAALTMAVGDCFAYSLAICGALLQIAPQGFDEAMMDEGIEKACVASNEARAGIFEEAGLPTIAHLLRHAPRSRPGTPGKPN
jgi:hypothetical protein